MSMEDKYSDEKLHLFIDDEMNSSDRARMMEAINNNEQLSNRVCELMQLKDAVRLAYSEPPASTHGASHRHDAFLAHGWLNTAAAVILLAVGTLTGWMLYPQFGTSNEPASTMVAEQQENIILHISKPDPEGFTTALAYAEEFINAHATQGNRLDIVAHADGLDMLRADTSPIKEQVIAMMDKHDNIHFIACAGTIRMYTQKNGAAPAIIRGVGSDHTAFDHIVSRLQTGSWKYIKVESLSDT